MNIAMILAAGQGVRMGLQVPKQFLEIAGKPLIVRTAERFNAHNSIDSICIVCGSEYIDRMQNIMLQFGIKKVQHIIAGGATRRESSKMGCSYLASIYSGDDIVLIHDAARPNVSSRVIDDNIAVCRECGACVTAIPTDDTILISKDSKYVSEVPKRKELYIVQTPQTFKLSLINGAHEYYENNGSGMDITDDSMLARLYGANVRIVNGEKMNIKVTSLEDVRILYGVTI